MTQNEIIDRLSRVAKSWERLTSQGTCAFSSEVAITMAANDIKKLRDEIQNDLDAGEESR